MGTIELEAGMEMDALVAERIMGWRRSRDFHGSQALDTWHWRDGEGRRRHVVAPYSTNIAAAWEVVEAVEALGYWTDVFHGCGRKGPYWGCRFDSANEDEDMHTGYADTAPLAICRASLQAIAAQ